MSRWLLPLLLACVAAVFVPVFGNGFVYDDTQLIVQGTLIHDPRNLPLLFSHSTWVAFNIYSGAPSPLDLFRPLCVASFMWDAALSGKSPWSYHLTNLALHLVCVLLVWHLARALLPQGRHGYAYLAAAWFGLAPLQAGAHVWISGRYEVLASALALGATLVWRAARAASSSRRAAGLNVATGLLFLLSLLSKEAPLLLLPALFAWPDRSTAREPLLRALLLRLRALLPFLAAAALYIALRVNALQGMRTHRSPSQVLLALTHLPVLLLDGLVQAVAPSRIYLRVLSEEYGRLDQLDFVLAASGACALALATFGLRRRFPLPAWGLLWFASVLAPACVVTTVHWPGFGRFLYLASAGLFVGLTALLAELWTRRPRQRRWLASAGALYVALLVFTLERYVLAYETAETLYGNVIEQRPDLGHGYGMLAAHYASGLRNLPEVARLYGLASERSPQKLEYAKGWADTLFLLGQLEPMLQVAESGQRRMGPHPEWELIQARALIDRDPERATAHLLRCLQLVPGERRCFTAVRDLLRDPSYGARYRQLFDGHLARIGPDGRLTAIAVLVRAPSTH